jgi:hypothetical protein
VSRSLDELIGSLLGTTEPTSFSRDLNAAWRVEEEIRRRGLEYEYEQALWGVIGPHYDVPEGAAVVIVNWPIIHATAEQRCLAAVRACGLDVPTAD